MKKLLITILLLTPFVSHANDYSIYHDALNLEGVTFVNKPINDQTYFFTYQSLDHVNKGKKLNLTIKFVPKPFNVGTIANVEGFYADNLIPVSTGVDALQYEFALLHEYAHSTGITNDAQADEFAQQYIKQDGAYNKLTAN
jgi:hypothetical protein